MAWAQAVSWWFLWAKANCVVCSSQVVFPISGAPGGVFNNALLILKHMEKCLKRCQVYLWKHEIEFKRCALPIWNVNSQNRKWVLLPSYFIAVSAAQSWRILPLRNYLFSNFWTRTSWPSAFCLLAARFPTTNMCLTVFQSGSLKVSTQNIWMHILLWVFIFM